MVAGHRGHRLHFWFGEAAPHHIQHCQCQAWPPSLDDGRRQELRRLVSSGSLRGQLRRDHPGNGPPVTMGLVQESPSCYLRSPPPSPDGKLTKWVTEVTCADEHFVVRKMMGNNGKKQKQIYTPRDSRSKGLVRPQSVFESRNLRSLVQRAEKW